MESMLIIFAKYGKYVDHLTSQSMESTLIFDIAKYGKYVEFDIANNYVSFICKVWKVTSFDIAKYGKYLDHLTSQSMESMLII